MAVTQETFQHLTTAGLAEVPVEQLSGGERYRVHVALRLGLAAALSEQAFELLLIDEVTDLDGDGAVDAADRKLVQQLGVWTQTRKTQPWLKLTSRNNTSRQFVAAPLYHFSEYAVCW